MISEVILTNWRSDPKWTIWSIVGVLAVGAASYFEYGGWEAAVRASLGILAFIVGTAVMADLLIWVLRRGTLDRSWYVLLAVLAVLLIALAYVANPLFLVLFMFVTSCVLVAIGGLKPEIYERLRRRK